MAVEEPPYQTIEKDGDFAIRAYPKLTVAEATVDGDQTAAVSKGFRLLAGYIFGGNQKRQKIAMTAPVTQAPVAAAGAPVTQTLSAGRWIVRFTMPAKSTLPTLPAPDESQVRLLETPPTRYAVVRFSGLARPDSVRAQTDRLLAWMKAHALQGAGPPTLAQYDPPWTLWFLRRNEVWIPLAAT